MNAQNISRNAPCYCGSGKRYKHCHGLPADTAARLSPAGMHVPEQAPDTVEALTAQGVQAAQNGSLPEAIRFFEQAVAVDPAAENSNLNLATALFQASRIEESLARIDKALATNPRSLPARHLRGCALATLGRPLEALTEFDAVIAVAGEDPAVMTNRGNALNMLARFDEALTCFDKALAMDPLNRGALVGRSDVLHKLQRDAEALEGADRALEVDPSFAEALNNRGNALLGLKRYEDALASYDRALVIRPEYAEALSNRGNVLLALRKPAAALASYDRAIKLRPDYAEAHYNLGNAFRDQGRPEEAVATYKQALFLKPDFAVVHNNLGNVLLDLGRLDEAVASFFAAISVKPDYPEAYNNLGNVLLEQGKPEEAAVNCRKALSIKADYAQAHYNLGNALSCGGKLDEAVASYNQAISFMPGFAEVHNNLGLTFLEQGKPVEAIKSFHQALALKSNYPDAYCNLGNALRDLGKPDEAIANYNKALFFAPDFATAYNNLAMTLLEHGELDEAIVSFRKALSIKPDYAAAHSNLLFALQFYPAESSLEVMEEAARFAARFEAPLRAQWQRHLNNRESGRRLKVGYVSPDFRRHAVAYFIEPVLANHCKDRLAVYCYYNHAQHDEITDRMSGYADCWLDCKNMTDEQLAERIRADGIDILVDLAGHTAHNRVLTFARKPAPIQIAYLGYPGTTGLAAMDYRLTDRFVDPPGSDASYTEKLLRLPDSLCCYRPGKDMPKVLALPAQQNGYVTFGSFNSFNKIDNRCIELWARLLRALPDSRLLMMTVPEGASRERLTKQFAALGVSVKRLEFHGKLPGNEFHRMFQRADIALDPIPVTGGTTTCETLWMGLPVIVLVGARYLSRVGYSFLRAAGLREFAAETTADYIEVAKRLAGNLPRLAELHAGMRAQVAASPLVDEAKFTRNLEKIYREVWTEWCNKVN